MGLIFSVVLLVEFLGILFTPIGWKGYIGEGFGGVENIGAILLNYYILPFEIASLLLLSAIIGAIVLVKRGIGAEDSKQ